MESLPRAIKTLNLGDDILAGPSSPRPSSRQQSVLASLPPELLCSVIYAVDPVSLIALAQTSRYLRSFIKPTPHHFLERLLRIELEEEHAAREQGSNSIKPRYGPLDQVAVGRTAYACSGCLRLRHHMMFDNHSIFKLKWRKPPFGSYEATKLTSWINPNDCDERGMKLQVQRQKHLDKANDEVWRGTYKSGVENADEGLWKVAELYLAGRGRTTRLCNDCKLGRGYFTRSNLANRSITPGLSIVVSRQRTFRTSFERYFPGLFPDLDRSDYPRLFKIIKEGTEDLKSLYTAKCSVCEKWKETADFLQIYDQIRFEGPVPQRPLSDKAMCNSCLAKERPRHLVRKGSEIALKLARDDQRYAQYTFYFGWRLLEWDLRPENMVKKKYWNHLGDLKTKLLAKLPWEVADQYGGNQKMLLVERCDLNDLRNRVMLFKGFCNWLSAADKRDVLSNQSFKYWVEDYEKLEKAWMMANARLEKVQDEDFGKALIAWVEGW